MFPLAAGGGLLFLVLCAGDFLLHCVDTRVVCVILGGTLEALGFGGALFVVVVAAMGGYSSEEWGGEGGRPVDGANRDEAESAQFSRGFRNINMSTQSEKNAVLG